MAECDHCFPTLNTIQSRQAGVEVLFLWIFCCKTKQLTLNTAIGYTNWHIIYILSTNYLFGLCVHTFDTKPFKSNRILMDIGLRQLVDESPVSHRPTPVSSIIGPIHLRFFIVPLWFCWKLYALPVLPDIHQYSSFGKGNQVYQCIL